MQEVKFNKDGRSKMVNRKLLSKALKLENQGMLVDFAWKKKILAEEVPLNELVIKECDNIQIPVSLQKIGNLKVISTKLSIPAFDKNYLPFDVSQKWELSGSKICSAIFEGFNLSALTFRYLRLPTELTNVQAKLQKLILFGNGGFIQSDSDCMIDGKIGTVILQLPVEGGHLGGNLNVEYKGRTKIFENHPNSDKNFYLSAFYNCCEYFTKPVTQGYQLNLVFDLIWTNVKIGIPQELPVFLTSLKQVKEALKPWMQRMDFQEEKVRTGVMCTKIKTENTFDNAEGKFKVHKHNPVGQEVSQPPDMNVSLEGPFSESFSEESDCISKKNLKENILFFILHEKYDMENFAFEFLRGKDRKMADLLQSCVFLDVHIAMATGSPLKIKTESSLNLQCEPVANLTTEENNEGIEISHLIGSDNVTRNVSIVLKWRKHFIEDIASDREKNCSENCRDKIELAKKHLDNGVMVIWPKYQAAQIYCRYGLESLLSSMEKSVSLPKWQEDARQSALNHLRQLISFCYAEPLRAWTTSGLRKGELTLRVLRLCITMRAHEEGLDLLKLLGSNFESQGKIDTENFEGIQNEEVAQAISDFVNEVTGWTSVAELIEPLLSRDRISKQLLPILKLAKCWLRSSCVQGANMVGDSVSSFFAELDQTRASRSKEFDVEAYLDMIVDLEMNSETSSRRRTASFVFFFAKVRSSLQCRLLLYFEAQFSFPLKNNQSCKELFNALCLKILSVDCNIYAPPVKTIIVDLVSCFIRLGNAEFLRSLILKICRVPDKVPGGFHVKNQNLVEKIVSSPTIWELATSSEEGRSTMASLVDHHLTLLAHQLSAFEDEGNEDQITTPPDKFKNVADQEAVFRSNPLPSDLSPCIWFLMEIQQHYDDENSHCLPIRVRVEWKTSLILAKLCAQQLMQLLIDVLQEHSGYLNKNLLSFGTLRTCQLFFSRIKDHVTVMPHRETVLELMSWFIQAGDDTLVRFILEQVCTFEKLGTWSYQQKYKLFEMLVSSPKVWMKLDSGSKLLVLKSCVDLVIVCNDISQNSSILHDCVRLLFLVEKNQPLDRPSIATPIFSQFLTKITTPQLMDLLLDFQLSEKKDPNITNFPACKEWYFIAYRIFFKQDFVSFVKSTEESVKKILKCLFWLNDYACWECFELQLCQSFPSEEGNLFLQVVVDNEDLREVCLNDPFALKAFRRILDHWIQYSSPQKRLPFTWRQPHAVLSDHPQVEIFLRSSQECMTYANFRGFSEARLFGEGLKRNGPENGFSVRAFPGGKGKHAYCEIVKNICHPSFFTKVIEARQSELEKLVQLRQDLHHGLYNSSQEAVQDTLAYFQGSSELGTTTGNWSSTFNPSHTAYIAPTPVNSQPVNWNAASHACASVTSTTSTGPMSTTSSKTSNDDDWSDRIDHLAADFRKAEEQLPIAPSPPPDDLVAFVDACTSSEKNATTKRRAIRFGCQSSLDESSQMTTASMSIAPPASWCSWKIPKTKKSKGNEDLAPKADAGKVKGKTNLDGKKSGRLASPSSRRNPFKCVSGANALPICDKRKKTDNEDPPTCRKCNQRGHTFFKCPNDPFGGRNIEKNPISLSCAPSAGINLATNEDWSAEKPYKETSRYDLSSRRKVAGNVYSWKRGQKTRRSTEPKPSDNGGASGDAWAPFPTLPDLPSTSGTSGIRRAGLDKCDMQRNVNENVPAPKRVVDVETRWNLKEIESSRKHDSLQPMGQFCGMELNKSDVQVPGIRKVGDMGLNVRENPIHCRPDSVFPDIRKKSNDIQLAVASIGFPQISRPLNPPPSTVDVCQVAWKGTIDGAEMGHVNVQALTIRHSTDLVDVSMPPSLSVVGRIRPERVWDYINQIRLAASHDVVILKFIPACDSDQKNYASFLSQLKQRDRFAVVGHVSKHIRDFYLISLPEGSAIPSAIASLSSATKLLDKNCKSSLLVGIVVRSRMNGKTGDDGAVVPTEKIHASIEIVPPEPPSSSVRNSTAVAESNPPSLINITNSEFFSALDVDMRITAPLPILPDVLKNLDIGDLQKILKTVQTKQENTFLRKRKFGDVDTNAEIIPTKLVKVAIDSSAETVPSKVTALPVKSMPPTSVSSSSANPIYICTSWPNSSTSDRIAKNIQTGPQSADLALYSPGLPMEPIIHIPAIDEDLLKKQNELMEELNSALPAWLAIDKKKTVMSENFQGPQQ